MCRIPAAMVALLFCATLAWGAPITGQYVSEELGGEVIDGRWSQSWIGGIEDNVGNTVHALSWDGATLGGQWALGDPILGAPAIDAPPTVLLDNRVGGTGTVVCYTTYDGGILLLKSSGPWWGGDPGTAYTVNVEEHAHTTTKEYVDGELVASSTVVNMTGTFADYEGYEISFLVAAAVPTGQGSAPPTDYPEFIPDTATMGAWGPAQEIRLEIVPEPATMALVGAGLVFLALARPRK